MKILPNGIAIIDGDTHVSRWVEESGRLDHDQSMLPLLHPYLGGRVVDVGAFIGDHTEYYSRFSPDVVAFEPNGAAFECLRHNMDGRINVECHELALGATNGTAALIENANAGMAALTPGEGVVVVPLDSFSFGSVTLLKIDVEGHECDVLEGARTTIARCRPVMLIEINDSALRSQGRTPGELITKIEGLQYKLRNIYEGQPMSGPQFDVLCTPLF